MSAGGKAGEFNCLRGDCRDWDYSANFTYLEQYGSISTLKIDVILRAPDYTTWSWGDQQLWIVFDSGPYVGHEELVCIMPSGSCTYHFRPYCVDCSFDELASITVDGDKRD